jgi:GNAT superfamily N-acetyltransferase
MGFLKTWISNLEDCFGKLYNNRPLLVADSSFRRNASLQILREAQGLQMVYRLRTDELDEALGEAVVSESENEVRLHGIFVKPEHRGKGYGEVLMKAVLSYAEAKIITLCTGLGNVSFFRRYGFEVTEIGDSLVSMERKL